MADENKRDYYERRKGDMKLERESFLPHYKELSENISPRRGRFEITDRNRGTKRHKNIINSTGTQALATARAGMFAGVMSPTRPWFDLATPDREMMKFMPVKVWLRDVAQRMRQVFNAGNLYVMAPSMIGELLQFGTGCMTHVDDEDNVARFYTHTAGSYLISQNDRYEVDTLVREFEMTAEQLATKFGIDNVSQAVKTAIDKNNLSAWFPVTHFIEPNDDFRDGNPLAKYKSFKSVHYEPAQQDKNKLLKVSGFDEFPAYVPRWGLTGEDIYGTDCPGMTTLGDVKQLQIQEKRKAQAIDKMVNPPLTGPASVRNVPVSSLPGGLTIYDGDSSRNKLESLYAVNINLADLREDMMKVEKRIDNAFFVDLFLAISNMEGIQPRNELELSERNAERLLQLGPVLERMQGEFLDLLVGRTFNQMIKADLLPPPPPEIEGQELKIDYISSLAQAQRAVDTRSIDKLTTFTGGLMSVGLSDGKKFNGDKAIDEYAVLVGTPPELIADDKDIAAQREQEAQLAAQAQQLEMAKGVGEAASAAGQGAQAIGNIDLDGNNPVAAAVDNINAG
jgi:hypothetical protein